MITNFFIPELNNHDVQDLWFQQDGATCHTARATIDLLKDAFGDRLISRFGPVNWPPRSCDVTPLDSKGYGSRAIEEFTAQNTFTLGLSLSCSEMAWRLYDSLNSGIMTPNALYE
ncbi:putative DD41D transposase [Trichonephila clavipes]|nr:putative DD41D transposase [Trichonephila clavipes]